MEKRRTWTSFGLTTLCGMAVTLGLLLAGEHLLRVGWQDVRSTSDSLPYIFLAGEGLIVGCMLGFLVGYYPSLEGLLSSLVIIVRLLIRDDFQISLDNFVELLLKFEVHFAALYLVSFILFLARGGGLYYPFFVGMRYLRFKMITAISVAGVALGVAAMVVVLSVMSGFEMDLKQKIVGTNAHGIVQKRGLDFSEWPMVIEKIRHVPGVIAATPFIYNEVMISSEYNISGVFIKGIEPETAGTVTNLHDSVEEGSLDLLIHPEKIDAYLDKKRNVTRPNGDLGSKTKVIPPNPAKPKAKVDSEPKGTIEEKVKLGEGALELIDSVPPPPDLGEVPPPEPFAIQPKKVKRLRGIFIGKELKKILKVRVGDQVNVVSPLSEELGPTGPVPMARSFRVAGVFATGMYEYDAKSVYVTLEAAQDFFNMGDTITGIGLKFHNLDQAKAICADILAVLDGYPFFTRTWYQMNKNLFTALKMEKIGMFILVVIVTLVSAFGIISTLIMLVWEKIKEIAILKSMGSTGDVVMKIFMIEGIVIGMVGTGMGLLLGWGVCLLLQNYGLQLDPEVYYIQDLPVNMDALEFMLIAGIALHISFIATIYPSRRASRLKPAEGLKYD
ncbi:MAG: ABC transporter permease [Deltaproteobacteria bacterium]|nr:ABC transporter permease [Deltaproteobacteria bacterium]